MTMWHAPAGKLVAGHVLDVARKPFERALRDHDKQLYVVWNPTKLKGWGCWEIRRHPNEKTAVYKGTHQGTDFYNLEYVEFKDINHVLDAAFLNYDQIRRVKQMDTWGDPHWVANAEARGAEYRAQVAAKAKEELKYAIRQNRSAASDFYEAVRSGIHPARVLMSTDWSHKA